MRNTITAAALVFSTSCSRGAVTQPTPVTQQQIAAPAPGPQTSYSLDGTVSDSAARPIAGATVEVLTGSRAGATAVTDLEGRFSFSDTFSGIPGMRASKAGYQALNSNAYVLTGTTIIRSWFRLGSLNPPVNLGGNYVVTFTADPACTALPSIARTRTYVTAIDSGNSTTHVLTLTGATFAKPDTSYAWNAIYVSVFEQFVRFFFSDPPVWELLDGLTSVYITGAAEGTFTGTTAEFPVSGEFEFCGSTANGQCEDERSCESSHHTLTLTRR